MLCIVWRHPKSSKDIHIPTFMYIHMYTHTYTSQLQKQKYKQPDRDRAKLVSIYFDAGKGSAL